MIIQMDHIFMQYKKHTEIIHDLNISIDKGEFIFLVGSSGAGKTTVLRMLYREIIPTSGEIIVAGQNIAKLRSWQLPYYRRKLGLVFQDFKLLPNRTISQNISLSMQVTKAKRSNIKKNVDRVLEWTALSHRRDALPDDISGGEQQRAAIARAIVNDPSVILADEPTGNLDPELSMEIMRMFERFNMRGATVLVATHNINLVRQFNKRIIRIDHGRIIE